MRPFRSPQRNVGEVSQAYNDGIVKIYSVSDGAEPGRMPEPVRTLKYTLMYSEQRVGITRYYTAQQYHEDVERIVRVQRAGVISNRDIAVTEDGREYAVGMVQTVDEVCPPSLDLTLTRIK